MSDAELREERVDGPHLDAAPSARVAERGRADVVRSRWHEQRERGEAGNDRVSRFRAVESLEQFLEDESGREDQVALGERRRQDVHFRNVARCVTAKSQRPHARIDEEVQPRERSAL